MGLIPYALFMGFLHYRFLPHHTKPRNLRPDPLRDDFGVISIGSIIGVSYSSSSPQPMARTKKKLVTSGTFGETPVITLSIPT